MIYINPNRRTDVYYAVTEKLHEWFGDVTSITSHPNETGGYDIFFDRNNVGTLNCLVTGIIKVFFDESDTSTSKGILKAELKSLMESGSPITIESIARVIIASKVQFKRPSKKLCRKLRGNTRYESMCLTTQWET